MITGAAAATVCYNIRQRHPTLELPLIDYDLALLFQPMLVLGISIGVGFNVIFADWMITVLLIILFIGIKCLNYDFLHVPSWKVFLMGYTDTQACRLSHSAKVLKHGKRKP